MSALDTLSPKVLAAGAGAGGGATVGGLILWLIGAGIFDGGWQAYQASDAVAAVPAPLALFVVLAVSVIGAVWAGYAKVDPDRNGALPTDIPGEVVEDAHEGDPDTDVSDQAGTDETTEGEPAWFVVDGKLVRDPSVPAPVSAPEGETP